MTRGPSKRPASKSAVEANRGRAWPTSLGAWLKRLRPLIGPAVLLLIEGAIALTGGPKSSPIHPLIYVWSAVAGGLFSPAAALFTQAAAALFEIALYWRGGEAALPISTLIAHLGFMALFASLFAFLLSNEVRAIRRSGQRALKEALDRVEQDAHDFRLIGSTLGPQSRSQRSAGEATRTRQVGSVRAIRESLIDVLEVARLATSADTVMLFVLSDDGGKLKLKECVAIGGERSIIERPIPASAGALGAVVKTRRSVNLLPREGGKHLGYRTRAEIGSFLGVPVLDLDSLPGAERLAGVLAVDRARAEPFSERDEELLEAISREAERAIESERIFVAMDRVKYEQERLYDAFALLNEALSIEAFAERLVEATSRIKKLDFAAVTLFAEEKHAHSIVLVRSTDQRLKKELEGRTFADAKGGLVAMALKNGHPLPYVPLSQQPDRSKVRIFGESVEPELESVKVFPLSEHGRPLGALVVGSSIGKEELTREEERMIEVVTAHAAITFANARMYAKMELMATTDGLTGLVNHRRLKELLEEALARATRFERSVSVLMVDADHFKTINDTYGHPVGDVVLRRIASLLQAEARRTDVVARYGGEEFVVILDESDESGALMVAERMRERIEREVVQGDFGRVRVTASLGLATWRHGPRAGKKGSAGPEGSGELLERADQALYEAKRKGRNQVIVSSVAHCASPGRPAIPVEEQAPTSSPPPSVRS